MKIFISYSRKDATFRQELVDILLPLEKVGKIEILDDKRNDALGTHWEPKLLNSLKTAKIVLLLITQNFTNSTYCCEKELPIAMKLLKNNKALVIPIIVREVLSLKHLGIDKLDSLPNNKNPVTGKTWKNHHEAWLDVGHRLEEKVDNIRKHGISFETSVGTDLILKPFSEVRDEIKRRLINADHVWLLCKTGLGYWKDFGDELDNLFKKKAKKNRLLVLNTQSEAFLSTRHEWKSWHLDKDQKFDDYQKTAEIHLERLYSESNKKSIKALDVILPLAVLIINPNARDKSNKKMFVEYPTNGEGGMFVHGGYQEKPIIEVTPEDHIYFYNGFFKSFEILWSDAKIFNNLEWTKCVEDMV